MKTLYTVEELRAIAAEARVAARDAADSYFDNNMNGQDCGACGFSWVTVQGFQRAAIKGNTKLGKNMLAAGFGKDHVRRFRMWNPAQMPVQSVDCLLAGSEAAARVLREYGFDAFADSRLD